MMKISDNQIIIDKIISQSVDKLWWRWTTPEGLKTFLGYDNKIELIPGGSYEIYFHEANPVGLKGSEGCKVLSYLPKQMLSFSWNAPPQFEGIRNSIYKPWVVLLFKPIDRHNCTFSLSHIGWPEGTDWEEVYDYFETAWDIVVNRLEKMKS